MKSARRLRGFLRLGAVIASGCLVALALPAGAGTVPPGYTPPPALPAATYKTVSRYVTIAMDDGVRLGATITFPSVDGSTPAEQKFPVVLSMTPYGRDGVCGCDDQTAYPSRGIISAVVDVRGTGGSGGNLDGNYFSPREQRDGYELVQWFGTQPWSTGKVGMIGGSYLGITQYLTAELRPSHLAAIAPDVALSDLYRDAYTYDGIPDFFFDTQYNAIQGGPGIASGNLGVGGASNSGTDLNPTDLTSQLSTTANAKGTQAQSRPIALDFLARPNDDSWYHDRSPYYKVDRITVPVLIVDGWRDGAFVRGALEMYQHLARRKGVETSIDLTACTHKGCGAPFDPMHSAIGYDNFPARTFDFMSHYLRGTPEHAHQPVVYDVQPAGSYVAANQWPPAGTRFSRLYLHPSVGSPVTPGALAGTLPDGVGSESYFTNPTAGLSMAFDSYGTVAGTPFVPTDQRLEQAQGLTWRTAPAAHASRIVGPIQLHLVGSSTATDTDWVARLCDVAPDGSQTVITEGALRASHRRLDLSRSTSGSPYHVDSAPQPLVAGRSYPFDVALIATAYELAPGHMLQLRVTTVDVPTRLPASVQADPSHPGTNVLVPLPPAWNTVNESAADPSWLLVPLTASR